jgi:hypothetical protein
MSKQREAYERLIELTKDWGAYPKMDAYIIHWLGALTEGEIEETVIPMLVRVDSEIEVNWNERATILGRIGNIIALTATPSQLLDLLQMPEVLSLEASRPGGSSD